MKLYFAESASSDNYILAECSDGIRCSNCAPDGRFADVPLWFSDVDGETAETVVEKIRSSIDPEIGELDLDWMGDPCYKSMDEVVAWNDAHGPFNQDTFYFIDEF